ncbi:hypothetical protein H2198_007469 [Neophaeococcomyces mojaviensis]|uniref:Uncharacterized protein n=1 Tax=Neophaeococcomyces mojaviensis TaxID=3383035 RepID=A0ACC3A032_9EURO|nr:hypothetical protein H2198_007469 [Knufia sp. JES_112]
MRLIDTKSLCLHEFTSQPPPYAILSHTWGSEEASFQDFTNGKFKSKAGHQKISKFCQKAAEDGWQYAWIDTCCIDKTSSAELSEAINSMFTWYKNAGMCFAYLDDVPGVDAGTMWLRSLSESQWFTRGWTLQELLAPCHVTFFNKHWEDVGTKRSLQMTIQSITGIQDLDTFECASLAQKFSWASKRRTTRKEDRVYSLLGLVGVNMPLLYGEGVKAFERLQRELLARSYDDSIFAWESLVRTPFGTSREEELSSRTTSAVTSILAASLDQFENGVNVRHLDPNDCDRPLWSINNCGLSAILHGYVEHLQDERLGIVIPLNCSRNGQDRLTLELTSYHKYVNILSALKKPILCKRANTLLGTITQDMCGPGKFRPIELLVDNFDAMVGTQEDSSPVYLRLSWNDNLSRISQILPQYCMWHESTDLQKAPRVAVLVDKQIYEAYTLIEPSLDDDDDDQCHQQSSWPNKRRKLDSGANGYSAEQAAGKNVASLKPLRSGFDCYSYLKHDPWDCKASEGATLLQIGAHERTIVYGFQSTEGGSFALIVSTTNFPASCQVDIIHSCPSLRKLEHHFNDNPCSALSATDIDNFWVAFKDCKSLKVLKSRLSIQIRPRLWLSAAVKLKNSIKYGVYFDVVVEASESGPKFFINQK